MQKIFKKIIFSTLLIFTLFPLISFAQVGAGEGKNASAISTGGAEKVSDTTASLNGSILSNEEFPLETLIRVYFRYSSKVNFPPVFCNDIFGSEMKATNEIEIGLSTEGAITFTKEISDLEPDTTYYFCAVGSNKNYIRYGEVKSFVTRVSSLAGMSVTTRTATVVDQNSVYLNGFYNTTLPSSTWFEFRKKDNQSNFLDKQSKVGKNTADYVWSNKVGEENHNGNTNGNISHLLQGLSKNTTYQYKTAIKGNSGANIIYGDIFEFKTSETGSYYEGGGYEDPTPTEDLTLGQTATPPIDAVVHYHEGIEHVFVRQIMGNMKLAKTFGYKDGMNLQNFAWTTADFFARIFGYVRSDGKEIRVSIPDIAAYRLELSNGDLTVYEYYDGIIVNIQSMTEVLRSVYGYEYYYKKKITN